MKKIFIILCLSCFACTSPTEREENPNKWGKILYRSEPFTIDITTETFIVKRKNKLYLFTKNSSPILLPDLCGEEKEVK